MNSPKARFRTKPLIAIADDDDLIRTVLRFAVEALDCDVLEASSGAATIALLRSQPIDVLILDVHFPGESFEQTWAEITNTRVSTGTGTGGGGTGTGTRRPGIILLSGDNTSPLAQQSRGVEFLRKPVELSEFQEAVARLLETVLNDDSP